jgi:DNA (cytosine-5)-methyltransferase 1
MMTEGIMHEGASLRDRAAHEPSQSSLSRPSGEHPLLVLSLFAGIGGFDLGLERTGGFKTVAFCEIDPFCRRVLAKHWPGVPIYDDVRELTGEALRADGIAVDAIAAGFPCQDASVGQTQWGKRVGIHGERTGLFFDVVRLAREMGVRLLLLENVPGLLSAGYGYVLGALADSGFDAEWRCLPASALGLPHRRNRLWIIGYASGQGLPGYNSGPSVLESAEAALAEHGDTAAGAWRALDRDINGLRGSDGLSVAMERRRVKALGNAITPQIPEAIGRALLAIAAAARQGGDVKQAPAESPQSVIAQPQPSEHERRGS